MKINQELEQKFLSRIFTTPTNVITTKLFESAVQSNRWDIGLFLMEQGAETKNALEIAVCTGESCTLKALQYLSREVINTSINREMRRRPQQIPRANYNRVIDYLIRMSSDTVSTLFNILSAETFTMTIASVFKSTSGAVPASVLMQGRNTTFDTILNRHSFALNNTVFRRCLPSFLIHEISYMAGSLEPIITSNGKLSSEQKAQLKEKYNKLTWVTRALTHSNIDNIIASIPAIFPDEDNPEDIYNHDYWISLLRTILEQAIPHPIIASGLSSLRTCLRRVYISQIQFVHRENTNNPIQALQKIETVFSKLTPFQNPSDRKWEQNTIEELMDLEYFKAGNRVFNQTQLYSHEQEQRESKQPLIEVKKAIPEIKADSEKLSIIQDNYNEATKIWLKIKKPIHLHPEDNLFLAQHFLVLENPEAKERSMQHLFESAEQINTEALSFANRLFHQRHTIQLSIGKLKAIYSQEKPLEVALTESSNSSSTTTESKVIKDQPAKTTAPSSTSLNVKAPHSSSLAPAKSLEEESDDDTENTSTAFPSMQTRPS